MARFVRFVVHQRIRGEPRPVGPFTAAYDLWREGDLFREERERLGQLLAWFEAELTIPPQGAIPSRAVFWYADVGPFSRRMWELVHLLKDHGLTAEQISSRSVGRVVYRDTHQVAALPTKRRYR